MRPRLSLPIVVAARLLLAVVLMAGPWSGPVRSADHREAPLISEDPTADIADVYAFTSPNDPTKAVFAMTVNGFAVPAVRSTYSFGTDVLYQLKIDNTGDGVEDLVIQAVFDGFETVRDPRCPAPGGGQFVTVLGPARPKRTGADNHLLRGKDVPVITGCTNTVLTGPGGLRAFAGLRDDPFVVDIGQLNRILGGTQDVFRGFTSPALGPLRGRAVRADGTSGVDAFGGFNASALVVEVPKALVQGSRNRTSTYLRTNSTIGFWGTTSRPKESDHREHGRDHGPYVQIQRMGQQVIKTVFIPAAVRDFFNATVPRDDLENFGAFFPDALTTTDNDGTGNTIAGRAGVLNAAGVTGPVDGVLAGAPLLLPAGFVNTDPNFIRSALLPDVLRVDLARAAGDLAVGANGYQNGRRLVDDVIDVVLRVARELADVKFPDGSTLPGSGALGSRRALDCSSLPCPDRRVLAVLQGTDFVEPDGAVPALATNGNDRALLADFPFFGAPHPLPGEPGTVGFPPPQ